MNKLVMISGSRTYKNVQDIWDYIDTLDPDSLVIHGGAKGVDTYAQDACDYFGITTRIFHARWSTYGRSAGIRRNEEMLIYTKNFRGRITAFWDGQSRGTEHAITRARNLGIPLIVVKSET